MYHIVGVTPEADSLETAFGPKTPVETFTYGKAEQRRVYDRLNAQRERPERGLRDAGMPACRARAAHGKPRGCSTGRRSAPTATSGFSRLERVKSAGRSERACSSRSADAGAVTLTDTCSAFAQAIATGDQGCRARFRETGALPAGHPRRAGLVRIDDGLHQRGAHRPVVRRAAMTVSTTIVLRGRTVVWRARRR